MFLKQAMRFQFLVDHFQTEEKIIDINNLSNHIVEINNQSKITKCKSADWDTNLNSTGNL